ncbi:MAG: DUF1080 domain-containing protein [Bryobacteraceae bacterium]|jgi:hypothetical protein
MKAICLVLMAAAALVAADNVLTPQEKAAGWVLLFDGKTLNGWDSGVVAPAGGGGRTGRAAKKAAPAPQPGDLPAVGANPRACSTPLGNAPVPPGASHWEVIDGALSPCGDPAGYLTLKANYKDFVLDADFKTGVDTNSGVFARGYEVQIWRKQPQGYNTGSIVGTAKTDGVFDFKADAWNHYEITCDGDRLIVVLNGTKTVDVRDSRFPEGPIRLQYQKYPIAFRNIKLKPIQR